MLKSGFRTGAAAARRTREYLFPLLPLARLQQSGHTLNSCQSDPENQCMPSPDVARCRKFAARTDDHHPVSVSRMCLMPDTRFAAEVTE